MDRTEQFTITRLTAWAAAARALGTDVRPDRASEIADAFPSGNVLAEFHRLGKQAIGRDLLDALTSAHFACAGWIHCQHESVSLLRHLLDVLLDKHRSAYDYASYIGIGLIVEFTAPAVSDPGEWCRLRARQAIALIGDAIVFEARCMAGCEHRFPQDRPTAPLATRRIRAALRAAGDLAGPSGVDYGSIGASGASQCDDKAFLPLAERAGRTLFEQLDARSRRAMTYGLLPVSVMHDEYLFLRVLQVFELLFSALAVGAVGALNALDSRDLSAAARQFGQMADLLAAAPSLFRLLATMRPGSFRAFRVYTEGASAIQSSAFKTFEVLCAHPPADRLCSAAFSSVPQVLHRYRTGLRNAEDFFLTEGDWVVHSPDWQFLRTQMLRLDSQYGQWKRIHCQLAARMLGDSRGTGSTEGTAYLRQSVHGSLFPFLSQPSLQEKPALRNERTVRE